MTKLSDTQLVILSTACQRTDRNVLPLPANLKGGAQQKVVASLLGKGLAKEVAAETGQPVWRETDGSRLTLVATDAAFQALGIEPEVETSEAAQAAAPSAPPKPKRGHKTNGTAQSKPDAEQDRMPAARAGTKQAQLIAMLQRPEGASLDEIVAATEWQAHTVRGAIAGALKKKLGLTITSEKVEGRGRVYRI